MISSPISVGGTPSAACNFFYLRTTKPKAVPPKMLDTRSGEPLLSTQQAADLLGMSARTLEGYRRKGGGPPFVALSRNLVRYRPADLRTWIEARTAPHTAKARSLLA